MRRVRLIVPTAAAGGEGAGGAPSRPRLRLASALLAVLALGAGGGAAAGRFLAPDAAMRSEADAVVAGGELARALERDPFTPADDPRPVRIGATFRARDGAWCRTFSARDGGGMAGVACRERGRWHVRMTTRTPRNAGTRMRAAAEIPPSVKAAAAQMMSGDPVPPAQARRVREGGWG